MGTFDDAKKYFPTPQPEYGPPKPKDKRQPLGLGVPMHFNGVVGRSSLDIPTTVTNPNNKPVTLQIQTTGTDFHASSPTGLIEPVSDGDNVADVFVQYVPTRPGTTHGLLHIISAYPGEHGTAIEQGIKLTGTATELEHLKPHPPDAAPFAIPDLTAEDKSASPRQQARNDLDALTGLADTYRDIVGAGDVAAFEMLGRIDSTTFEFAQEIGEWVRGELEANKISEASSNSKLAWKALGAVIGKSVELLEMGSVVTAVVGLVADQAFDHLKDYVLEDHQRGAKEAAGSVASGSGSDLIAATNLRVKNRIGPLAMKLSATRASVQQLGGQSAMQRERVAQVSIASGTPHDHASIVEFVDQFREALRRYDDACRAIAATDAQLRPTMEASFNGLRMQYLKMRAKKSSDLTYRVDYGVAWDLGSEDSHGRETFRAFEPRVSGVSTVSEQMRGFIAHRKLSDYAADANVSVTVECKQGGFVIIEKRVGGEPLFTQVSGTGAVRAFMRGPHAFWTSLEENIG
ncbi:hypothetical protein BH11MYX1_BH11MYX1_07840 [soil metagenome]